MFKVKFAIIEVEPRHAHVKHTCFVFNKFVKSNHGVAGTGLTLLLLLLLLPLLLLLHN